MSRIHHARKSVDLDRGALHSVDVELERLGENTPIGRAPVTEVAGTVPIQPDPPLKLPADAAVADSILLSCARHNWEPHPDMTIFFGGKELTPGAEEFRSLRSQLYRVRKEQNLRSLLIASALPKEGRSFVAANLAQVLALQSKCRVLLIDADLRNPRLHSIFGTSGQPGLSEYLLQEADEFSVMQRGSAQDLFLIPAGRSVEGQTELVASGRLRVLIDQIGSLFDWIIVDSPAAIPVTDACLLANSCDGVLLVVRSHSTPFDIVKKARQRFREESLVGVVLNKIETEISAPGRKS